MPTGQPWQKPSPDVSPAEDRYLMTVIATASNPRFWVSRVDIDRAGPTYTIDTLRDLRERAARRRPLLHHRRRRAERHLHLARRRRAVRPRALRRLHPARLHDGPTHAARASRRTGSRSWRSRRWRSPRPTAASASMRGEPVWYLVPDGVVQYITKYSLYTRQSNPPTKLGPPMTATDRALELVRTAAQAASDKQAENIVAFDVSEQLVITDAFLLVLGAQRPPGQGDRRRHRGPAARDRRQAGAPRGRARRPLGAHRLRRDRRARAARGGAVLLRPRAALARLPADRAARHA